ncbi:unnamed protein product [Zymoseptoria tritici ST99CH_1A5]|uniref:Uncharacterized protein n=1 Tax=Zymoseptoria tritici ST99CH_1A5 TaxID=1276529 RepID=A0A1Y6M132_ZYMTR|nr:unnamed protein product [Zymoseptoria tritici ST99CH_1A5]
MENDEDIEVVEFTPVITTFPHYAVVIAATYMYIHRPVPDDIVAFSPIWSYAITTLASGTADGDNDLGAALATVADVLPSTADVISTISQPNSSKKGGRVTKTAEEIRYHNKLSKLICEALDAKAALAEALLADVALITYLASFALDRSGGAENQFDGDVQEEIVSFEASLAAQRGLTQTRTTETTITQLEAQLRRLKGSQPEPLNVHLRVVQKHMRHLAGFIAARRTEYGMEKSKFAWR